MMRWARERAGLRLEDLALSLQTNSATVEAWETDEKDPTFRQAQQLAKRLSIPFGYLYLSKPPTPALSIPDLRTVGNENLQQYSLDFRAVLGDTLRKQNWYREKLEAEGVPPLPFVGQFTLEDDYRAVVDHINQTLKLDDTFRRSCSSWEDFLSKLIDRVEEAGVLVLRSGVVRNNNQRKLDVQEFRGFVRSDQLVPVIFINNNDAKSAQIFTLVHELAHVWLGASGVSNPDLSGQNRGRLLEIERFCNRVAAELLVPEAEFKAQWDDLRTIPENTNRLSRHFRVSPLVLLIRAGHFQLIAPEDFRAHYPRLSARRKKPDAASGNFNNTLPVRHSKKLTREI
ncbi:MAG: ImmA/IrrE family metallo-endopeptidase, partial [Phaeodactylibacter sp.]|nr:ImmA/IrrE family metallo-endopeptidase [Phaeodactylibacter sp.]